VITDNDLSPAQERNLEEIHEMHSCGSKPVIMDILQPEGAHTPGEAAGGAGPDSLPDPQAEAPLDAPFAVRGGIGMRGPGETQLEEDKRILSRRIQKSSSASWSHRGAHGDDRGEQGREFVVALVGYTNAGKSTLLTG